jgi:transposase
MDGKESTPHDWREWRRLQAVELTAQGWPPHTIAAALGVTPAAVSQWLAAWRRGGLEAMRAHPSPGRPTRLAPEQRRLIPDLLSHGAEAYGFRGAVWTCARIARVIEWEFGVRYHPGHVSRLMQQLQWTPQIPMTQALQRDEREIQAWRQQVWPQLKYLACPQRRTLVFVDESGFYLLPGVVKTYGPKGRTPILKEWQSHDHLSVISGITRKANLYTLVRQTALTGADCVGFLEHLLRQIARRLLVLWDGSPIHRGPDVREFLAEDKRHKVHLERLPPYAPDLNPEEGLRQHLKHVEMRNLTCLDLEELHLPYHLAIGRVRQKPHLIQSFFAGAGLDR